MSGIDDIVKEKFEDIDGVVYLKGRGKVNISKYFLEEIAYKVAKEIFEDLEKKRDKLWRHKCKYGLRERVEFLKDDYDEVKKEWLGDEE